MTKLAEGTKPKKNIVKKKKIKNAGDTVIKTNGIKKKLKKKKHPGTLEGKFVKNIFICNENGFHHSTND